MASKKRTVRITLAILPFMVVAGLVSLAILYNFNHRPRMEDNERGASTAIKTLAIAEADYRTNERDGNGIKDYWTGDVAGLYVNKLIQREIAEADANPLNPLVPKPIPYRGYFFIALDVDDSVGADYRRDTDGKSGRVHNLTRFGFCAYPAVPGQSGRTTFIISEYNLLFEINKEGTPVHRWPADLIAEFRMLNDD